jgi:uncharacterized membrane protein
MESDKFFTEEQKATILDAIASAEKDTSGEIRVHIETACKDDVLDCAAFLFEKLKMHETKERNGVLFYVSVVDRKFAILGDAGINAVVPGNFWDEIKELVIRNFKMNRFTEGLSEGIIMAGNALKQYFPCKSDDVNELTNDISFGKN